MGGFSICGMCLDPMDEIVFGKVRIGVVHWFNLNVAAFRVLKIF